MKATYKVIRNEEGKIIDRLFIIDAKENEDIFFIANRLYSFYVDVIAENTICVHNTKGYSVAEAKELFRKEYNNAKEAWKNRDKLEEKKTEEKAPVAITVKAKKPHARRKNLVKAMLLTGTFTKNRKMLATYARLDYGELTAGKLAA